MQPKRNTVKLWRLPWILTSAMLIFLAGCDSAPQVPNSLPVLPLPPAVTMPPKPTEILQRVESNIRQWDESQQKRVQQLGP